MSIEPKSLVKGVFSRTFNISYTKQINTARALYGKQLYLPHFTKNNIISELLPILEYNPERDRVLIAGRVAECILIRQKFN